MRQYLEASVKHHLKGLHEYHCQQNDRQHIRDCDCKAESRIQDLLIFLNSYIDDVEQAQQDFYTE